MRNSSRLNIFLKFSNVLPISKSSITKMILGQFLVDCRKTKTKLNTTTSQNKGRSHHLPMLEAREKVSGQVGTGISFVFDYLDWLR